MNIEARLEMLREVLSRLVCLLWPFLAGVRGEIENIVVGLEK